MADCNPVWNHYSILCTSLESSEWNILREKRMILGFLFNKRKTFFTYLPQKDLLVTKWLQEPPHENTVVSHLIAMSICTVQTV